MWLDRLVKEKLHQQDCLEDGSMAANQLGRLSVQQQEGALGTCCFFKLLLNVPLQVDQRTAGDRFWFPFVLYDSPHPATHFFFPSGKRGFLPQWANLERVLSKTKHAKPDPSCPPILRRWNISPPFPYWFQFTYLWISVHSHLFDWVS